MTISFDEKKYPFLLTCKRDCSVHWLKDKGKLCIHDLNNECPQADVFRAIHLLLQYSEDKRMGCFKLKLHFG